MEQSKYLDLPTLRYDLFHRITGLETGVEYTVRVKRVTTDGDSGPSNEAAATPVGSEEILRITVEKLIATYGDDSPWIQQTWLYLQENNIEFYVGQIDSGLSGEYEDICDGPDPMSGLYLCTSRSKMLDDPTNEAVIVHELAHAYSMDGRILDGYPEKADAIAIALIYMDNLQLYPGGICNKYEFLADLMTLWELGDKSDPWYWNECEHTPLTSEALEIVSSALDGKRLEWFSETYSVSGVTNLEKLWKDIQEFERRIATYHEEEQQIVVYHLRNAFGGYCHNANATASMFGDGPTRNPWRDGGCVPSAPEIEVTANANGDLSISWTAPDDDGSAPIEGYQVQWRSDDQQYTRSRQVATSDSSTFSYQPGGLPPGIRHHVQVLAYDTNGDGTRSDEVAALTKAAP